MMLRISFNHNIKNIVVRDIEKNKLFIPTSIPSDISINSMIFSAEEEILNQLLLHELNHWYTIENTKYKVNPHGKEFKHFAKKIGLKPEFAKHSIVPSQYNINIGKVMHQAKCSNCNKVVYFAARKKTVTDKCDNSSFSSKCCSAKLKYHGSSEC